MYLQTNKEKQRCLKLCDNALFRLKGGGGNPFNLSEHNKQITKQILNFHSWPELPMSNVQQIQENRKKKVVKKNCNSHGTQQIARHKLHLTGAHCNSADMRQPDDSRHKG